MKKFHRFFLAAYKYIIIICVLVLVFFVIRKLNTSDAVQKVEYKTDQADDLKPILVGGEKAFKGDLIIRVSSTGIAQPSAEINITPEVSGRVIKMFAEEGDIVKKGDPLFQIDDSRYQLSYEDARDNVKSAQAKFVDLLFTKFEGDKSSQADGVDTELWYEEQNEERFSESKRLYEQGKITREEFAEASLYYKTAKDFAGLSKEDRVIVNSGLSKALIAEKRAELDLENTIVRAPFSGTLGDQNVCLGMYVTTGTVCYKLVDLSIIKVNAGCLESEVKDITVGRKAEVTFSGYPDEVFTGRVKSVNPLVDSESKTCRVMVELANPDNKIKAGMFAFVKLEATILPGRLLVPRQAILVRGERDLLFIARKGKAIWSYVDLGRSNEEYYEILRADYNLAPGDTVLTENHYTMFHDALVTVQKN